MMVCIMCGGDVELLGSLGRLQHGRCRQCGMYLSSSIDDVDDVDDTSEEQTTEVGPVYAHHCEECEFLGHFEEHDLYFCGQGLLGPNVIARCSGTPSDYTSGLASARSRTYDIQNKGPTSQRALRVAYLIARDLEKVK